MTDRYYYLKARRKVKKRKNFYKHLASFICVSVFLVLLNIFTSPWHFWAIYPILGWGLGLAFHGASLFNGPSLSDDWEDDQIKREMDRLKYRDRHHRSDERLELRELKKEKAKWRDSDLV